MDTDELNSGTTPARTTVEFQRPALSSICVHRWPSVAKLVPLAQFMPCDSKQMVKNGLLSPNPFANLVKYVVFSIQPRMSCADHEIMKTGKPILIALALLGLATLSSPLSTAFAQGPLTPPGPPGPTMVTLSQVEPRFPIFSLPTNLTTSGAYFLTTNLTVAPGYVGDGITISVSDVTLDLHGFTLTGVSGTTYTPPNGITVANTASNVDIRNGKLDSWGGSGVNAPGASNCTVIGCTATGNGIAIQVAGIALGNTCIVKDCIASGNGSGISVMDNCIVTGCTASANNGNGIIINNNSTATGCTASENPIYGIGCSRNCSLSGCTASGNRFGLYVYANGTVTGCTASGNSASGISALFNSTVTGCTASGNSDASISAVYNCAVTGCTASGNSANGIEAFIFCTVSGCTAGGNSGNGIELFQLHSGGGSFNTVIGCTASGNSLNGILIDSGGVQNRIDGNNVANNSGYGINPTSINQGNVIIRNSAPGNTTGAYFGTTGNNDYAPIQAPGTTTGNWTSNPWANF
jgi:parallel beta-helix repeat protein